MNQTAQCPTLPEALDVWHKFLAGRGLSNDCIWIFQENLCIEKLKSTGGGFHFGFQTKFTPPGDDALDVAFEHFIETGERLVFYRLGECVGKSVCILLCDSWFDAKTEEDGFFRHERWNMSFHPGNSDEIEEIVELGRWLRRVKHDRTLHDLDFCMSLAMIEEIRTYGRPLLQYERLAETMLKRLRRVLGQPA